MSEVGTEKRGSFPYIPLAFVMPRIHTPIGPLPPQLLFVHYEDYLHFFGLSVVHADWSVYHKKFLDKRLCEPLLSHLKLLIIKVYTHFHQFMRLQ